MHEVFKHTFDDLLVVVSIRKTYEHYKITLLPVDCHYKVSKKFPSLIIDTKELGHLGALRRFEDWWDVLKLKMFSRIIPVAFDWPKVKSLLEDFFGYDDQGHSYAYDFFHNRVYRDVRATIYYLEDVYANNNKVVNMSFGGASFPQVYKKLDIIPDTTSPFWKEMVVAQVMARLTKVRFAPGGHLF